MSSVPWRPLVPLLLVLSPTAVLAVLLADPQRNTPLFCPSAPITRRSVTP